MATRAGLEASRPGRAVVALVGAHVASVVAEWASVVAVLVYAFEQSGARATGLASLAVLAPQLLGAPLAAALTASRSPRRVRLVGMLVQAVAYGVGALAAAVEAPVVVVVAAAVVALLALSTLRPTGAVLLPALVRSTAELTRSNLRIAQAEGVSALAGPLAAAALLATGGPAAALGGCAALLAAAALLTVRDPEGAARRSAGPTPPVLDAFTGALQALRARRWTIGVLGVVAARSAVVGALDVVLVVLALDELDLGGGGAGVLNALVGAGALVSAVAASLVVRQGRLAPWLAVGVGVAAAACLLLAAVPEVPVAVVVLPFVGLAGSLAYGLGTMLLQRAADPRLLGSLFALIELVGGVGLLAGSGLAQVLIALADVRAALAGLAVALVVVVLVTARSVWRADADADVPVVEMALLHELPMFDPLPPLELESVARTAEHVSVDRDEVVIRQGDSGDRFYAVAAGSFDIVMDGERVRVARRGSCFGEVALLADVPRTATVTALEPGALLAIERVPFLVAVTGRDASLAGAWAFVQAMPVADRLPGEGVPRPPPP